MTLHEAQVRFCYLRATLVLRAFELGYEVTEGESWRSPQEAARDAAAGIGIAHSLHCDRLASDLNLFRDGVFLTATEDYRPLGEWWEQQNPECRWGGRFSREDGNHFSFAFQGRA